MQSRAFVTWLLKLLNNRVHENRLTAWKEQNLCKNFTQLFWPTCQVAKTKIWDIFSSNLNIYFVIVCQFFWLREWSLGLLYYCCCSSCSEQWWKKMLKPCMLGSIRSNWSWKTLHRHDKDDIVLKKKSLTNGLRALAQKGEWTVLNLNLPRSQLLSAPLK